MQIGEILGNLPNKECEDARGDILMDIGPSTGLLLQVLPPSFSSYEDDDCEMIVPELKSQVGSTSTIRVLKIPLHSWLATKFQKLPSVLLLERSWHIQEDVIIRFIFPSMVVKRNTISQFLMNKFMIIYGYFLHLLRHCRSN